MSILDLSTRSFTSTDIDKKFCADRSVKSMKLNAKNSYLQTNGFHSKKSHLKTLSLFFGFIYVHQRYRSTNKHTYIRMNEQSNEWKREILVF